MMVAFAATTGKRNERDEAVFLFADCADKTFCAEIIEHATKWGGSPQENI
ncbi:MAG: hypothetical protein ABI284_03465 [Nitrosospira sp.]